MARSTPPSTRSTAYPTEPAAPLPSSSGSPFSPCLQFVESIEDSVGVGKGSSRAYATVDLDRARVGRTKIVDEPVNPVWNESFHIYCAHDCRNVIFSVKFDNAVGATLIGRAYLPADEIVRGQVVDRWLPVCDESQKPLSKTKIHIKVLFSAVYRDPNWSRGILSPSYAGVPNTYFPQQKGCKVTLYQDAHVPDGFTPPIYLSDGAYYEAHRCWEDIFDAIYNAQNLIYIAGWSVYTEITLLRDPRRPEREDGGLTVGELLKKKADQGVRVLMLVWDDRTSMDFLTKAGFMATHDQETAAYFQGTDVKCVLCPRNSDKVSYFRGAQISTMFSHHQKFVIVDAEMPQGSHSNKRRIVSFVGGLDLCDGRYDTQQHSLFRTLGGEHEKDFYQGCFAGAARDKGGPRQPWHDIHSKLEGPIAWDVLQNFEERWKRQGGRDYLVHLEEVPDLIIRPSAAAITDPDGRDTWNVQLFRSIDGGAVFGFPDDPDQKTEKGLVTGKENVLERSIQDAYIHAIRRAKDFIYIENQYFIGSCYGWGSTDLKDDDIGALNLIPKELSLKICSKIEAGERFAVYVVIPMWPEGVPEKGTMQEILDWQRRTMQMMYRDIAEALKRKGMRDSSPRDYLTFFCLGNKEVRTSDEYFPPGAPEPGSNYERSQMSRRLMIYVHSKMMIVDDEYIIVGSANINQRSMDGARDSEIAMGAYQPHHISTNREEPPRGQIHGFRMALWYEHLGMLDNDFVHPKTLECTRKVNRAAERYWDIYLDGELTGDLPGHLLSYPIRVRDDGEIVPLDGVECFPDTNAPVLGCTSFLLPDIATT